MDKEIYTTIGAAIELLAHSNYHQDFNLNFYLHTQIYPPIKYEQIFIYYSDEGKAIALVTAAWVSDKTLKEITSSAQRILNESEWQGGEYLLFNDFIAPYGDTRSVLNDLRRNVFHEINTAYSVRKRKDGTIRKINVWWGANTAK